MSGVWSGVWMVLCAAGLMYFSLLNSYDACAAIPFLLLVMLLIAPALCFWAGFRAGKRGMRKYLLPLTTAAAMLPLIFIYWWFLPPVYGLICLLGERTGRGRKDERQYERQNRR